MEHYRLIGYPLGHSMSPPIHTRLFALEARAADYALDPFPPDVFAARLPELFALDGFNITIPYKETILPYLDELHDSARLYGAVNTVRCTGGRRVGYNTDCDGFLRALSAHDLSLAARVCVLGAGGVGRMFAIETARQGGDVTVVVRESGRERALSLRREISEKCGSQITVCAAAELTGSFDLLINATPVGMFPHTDTSPVPKELLARTTAVFDCIYNPTETLLLRQAKAAGCRVLGGMDMLVWQAAAAHEYWNGTQLNPQAVARLIPEMEKLLRQREKE